MKSLALLSLITAALAGCARTTAPMATDADASRARQRWPGITVDELNQGRQVFLGHCGACHLPPKPTDYTPESWPEHVHEMQDRAGADAAEAQLIERYLVTMARAAE